MKMGNEIFINVMGASVNKNSLNSVQTKKVKSVFLIRVFLTSIWMIMVIILIYDLFLNVTPPVYVDINLDRGESLFLISVTLAMAVLGFLSYQEARSYVEITLNSGEKLRSSALSDSIAENYAFRIIDIFSKDSSKKTMRHKGIEISSDQILSLEVKECFVEKFIGVIFVICSLLGATIINLIVSGYTIYLTLTLPILFSPIMGFLLLVYSDKVGMKMILTMISGKSVSKIELSRFDKESSDILVFAHNSLVELFSRK